MRAAIEISELLRREAKGSKWLYMAGDGGAIKLVQYGIRPVLRVVLSWGLGWDHVSVSTLNRVPNYGEMRKVKALCFRDDETAMELHVPPADHVNNHEFCLHLWRPHDAAIPRPPYWMVGLPGVTHDQMQAMSEGERLALADRLMREKAE